MRRKRRGPETGVFQDPLKNYDTPEYEDNLERSLMDGKVGSMKVTPFTAVTPDTTVEDVMRQMDQLGVACVLVVENERLKGIFSERDVLMKVADDFASLRKQPVSRFMTPNPAAVHRTDSPAKALNLMAVSGFRHVPILDIDDRVVGILGPRRITNFIEQHFRD